MTNDGTHGVVHAHLIVQVVKATGQIVTIFTGVIYLANEEQTREFLLDLGGGVGPELGWHHLGHVTAEGVNALSCPEEQDVGHFLPRGGHGVKVPHPAGIVVHAVVQLDRLVPVVAPGGIVEDIVTRSLGGFLQIGFFGSVIEVEVRREALTWTIVEIIPGRKALRCIIVLTKILHTTGPADAVVLSGHMVGHEVNDDLHTCLMGTLHKLLELRHAVRHINRQVGVNVVIVRNGIG